MAHGSDYAYFFHFLQGLKIFFMISPEKAPTQIKKPPEGGFFLFLRD